MKISFDCNPAMWNKLFFLNILIFAVNANQFALEKGKIVDVESFENPDRHLCNYSTATVDKFAVKTEKCFKRCEDYCDKDVMFWPVSIVTRFDSQFLSYNGLHFTYIDGRK